MRGVQRVYVFMRKLDNKRKRNKVCLSLCECVCVCLCVSQCGLLMVMDCASHCVGEICVCVCH